MGGRQPRRHQTPDEVHPEFDEQGRFHGGAVPRVPTDAGLRLRTHPGLPVLARAYPSAARPTSRHAATSTRTSTPADSARCSRPRPHTPADARAVVGDRERHRRRGRHETAALHREPHRGRAGHGHARQPDIRGYTYWSFVDNLEWADWLPPSVRPLRVRPDDARAGAHTEAGQHARSAASRSSTGCRWRCCRPYIPGVV